MSRAFEIASHVIQRNTARKSESRPSLIASTILSKQKEPEENGLRLLAEQLAQGAISVTDIPQDIIEAIYSSPQSPLMYPEYEQEFGIERAPLHLPRTSTAINKGIKEAGLDIQSQVPRTPLQKIGSKAARFAGSALGGGAGIRSSLMAGLAGGIGGGLEEAGTPPILSDIAGAVIAPSAVKGAAKIGQGAAFLPKKAYKTTRAAISPQYAQAYGEELARKQLHKTERRVVRSLKRTLGDELPSFEKALSEYVPGEYPLTTAEATKNVRLSQLQRGAMGSETGNPISKKHEEAMNLMKQRAETLGKEGSDLEQVRSHYENLVEDLKKKHEHELHHAETLKKEALKPFEAQIEPEIPGRATQEFMSEKARGIRRHAVKSAKPHYEHAFKEKEYVTPSGTLSYIKHAKEVESPPVAKILADLEKDLTSTEGLTNSEKKTLLEARNLRNERQVPDLLEKEKKEGILVQKLENERRRIEALKRNSSPEDYNSRRVYTDIIKRLDSDMSKSEAAPHIKQAKKIYQEKMEPFNAINESPVFKKVLSKVKGYSGNYNMYPSEVPKEFLSGNKSRDTAKELKGHIAKNKDLKDKYRGFANKMIVDGFVEPNGKIKVDSYHSFLKSNPGLFEVFPDMTTKLKNAQNAQLYVNNLIKQNDQVMQDFYKESAKSVLNGDVNQMMNKIFQGDDRLNRVKHVIKEASKDKTGGATEGLRIGARDFIFRKMGTGQEWTHHKFKNLLNTYKTSFEEIFMPEQMRTLEETGKYLTQKAATEHRGAMKGSQTKAHLANHSILEGIATVGVENYVKKFPGMKWFFEARKEVRKGLNDSYKNIMGEVLADPIYAKAIWLKPNELSKNSPFAEKLKNAFFSIPEKAKESLSIAGERIGEMAIPIATEALREKE